MKMHYFKLRVMAAACDASIFDCPMCYYRCADYELGRRAQPFSLTAAWAT